MKTTRSLNIFSVLLAVSMLALGNSAKAQQSICSGSFVLPFDVQWNDKTLAAGQYQFSLRSATLGGVLVIRDAKGTNKMFVLTLGLDPSSKVSGLIVLNTNGKHYVSSLILEPIGKTLTYSLPARNKTPQREVAASSQLIPVHIV